MKTASLSFLTLVLVALLSLSTMQVYAQGVTTAALNGVVTDENGGVLPAANVIAIHLPTGTQYGITTRTDGKYNLYGLRTGGPYEITVSFVGYTSKTVDEVYLALGQNLRIDFVLSEKTLQLGEISVTAEKNSIMSEGRTGSSQNISLKQIEEIPTVSRNFQSFAKLSPLFSGTNLQAAGRSNRYNNIQIDGTQYNDLFGLGSSGTPGGQTGTNPISLDAIEEFQVVIAPYDVRQSGFTGGGINAITRGGTNKYSGSAYFFGRNQDMMGKSPSDDEALRKKMDKFSEYQYGFRVGGPIMKDKLFFFANGELTQDTRPSQNLSMTQGDPTIIAKNTALADSMRKILVSKGFDPGSFGSFDIERPSTKLFTRFDYNLSNEHKLTLRYNFVDAYQDILGNRTSSNAMSFDSYAYRIKNKTHSLVAQINSNFGNAMSNELIVGFTSIRDRRSGVGAASPEIKVLESGLTMSAGVDQYSSANELDQDILEITDNFTYLLGSHVFTFGTHNEFFSFRNLFIGAFHGYYEFKKLDDLQNEKISFYSHKYSRTNDPQQAAEFKVSQLGFYVQDEWSVMPKLKVTIGARIDIPFIPEAPAKNDSVSKYLPNFKTDEVPSGNILFSPRLGFNYDVFGDRTTQVRGGVGLFTGRIPYVWISNAYTNSGMLYAEVRNLSATSYPGFSVNPYQQWLPGDPGTGSPRVQSEINLTDTEFKMPQILRYNASVDQQLPFGFIGTVEFVYSKSINDLVYTKENLKPSTGVDAFEGRTIWGGTYDYNKNFYDVLVLKNTSKGYSYNLSFQVQRNMARGLSVNAGYVFGKAMDQNSVASSQARSQMRYNPIDNDPNNPELTTSLYEIQHRIFGSVSYTEEFLKGAATTISLYFNGQSGQPFSFVVQGDVNNDGFDWNDLFYIPKDRNDIQLGTLSGGVYTAKEEWLDALDQFIKDNEYLNDNRGKMSKRNGARNPWRNILDLRIAQDIPDYFGFGKFQVTLDILNVLNLLDPTAGWDKSVYSTYAPVKMVGRDNTGRMVYSLNTNNAKDPYTADNINSRWAMQLGIRYSF